LKIVHVGASPRIAVLRAGEGQLVLFLHGIGGGKESWRDQIPFFAREFQAAAWDARGYGDSEDYEGPCRFGDFASDLLRVIDFYAAPKAHLIGLSMGGRIAQHCYFRFPDRIASLTLCDTQLSFQHRSEADRDAFLAAREAPLRAGKTPREIAPAVVKSLMAATASQRAIDEAIETMARLRVESYLKTLATTVREPMAGDLTSINIPVHVIVGEHDKLTPPAISAEMAAQIPGARLSIVPGAGHLSNIEAPEHFNQIAIEFLRQATSFGKKQ
jgi:3-oxoadipate enol-lactonase